MTSERFAQAVARHLATQLHKSTSGYRCRCGGCRHQILAVARRTGLRAAMLVAALLDGPGPLRRGQPTCGFKSAPLVRHPGATEPSPLNHALDCSVPLVRTPDVSDVPQPLLLGCGLKTEVAEP